MSESDDNSANVTPPPSEAQPLDESSGQVDGQSVWNPATAQPATAMATWRALDQARNDAQETYEAQIAPFKSQFESAVEPIDQQLEAIEKWFLAHSTETGANSFDSEAGKVTISMRETPKITDAESFFSWAASSNNVGLLQKRISVTQFREFVKSNPDETPPGVTVESDQSIKFKPAG